MIALEVIHASLSQEPGLGTNFEKVSKAKAIAEYLLE